MPRVVSGLERLLERPEPLRGLRVGLIVNPASITRDLVHALDGAHRARREAHGAVRARARRARRRAGHDRRRRRARSRDRPAGAQPLRPHGASLSPTAAMLARSTSWCSTSRTSAAATTRSCGRWCSRCARARRRARRSSCSIGRTRSAATPIEGGAIDAGYRVVRRARVVPESPRHDRRRDRALAARGREARPRARGDRDARLAARHVLRAHRPAVGDAVAEHADGRHRARLSGHVPRRGHGAVRGPRHDAAVRARRGAVLDGYRLAADLSARAAGRAASGRSSSRRRSRSTRTRRAAACSSTSPIAGVPPLPDLPPADPPRAPPGSEARSPGATRPTSTST